MGAQNWEFEKGKRRISLLLLSIHPSFFLSFKVPFQGGGGGRGRRRWWLLFDFGNSIGPPPSPLSLPSLGLCVSSCGGGSRPVPCCYIWNKINCTRRKKSAGVMIHSTTCSCREKKPIFFYKKNSISQTYRGCVSPTVYIHSKRLKTFLRLKHSIFLSFIQLC